MLGSAAALVAGLCLAPAAQAAPDPTVSFGGATAVPLPAGSGKGTAPALGDLDGDGKADLVTPVKGSNTLVAALGDAAAPRSGTYRAARPAAGTAGREPACRRPS